MLTEQTIREFFGFDQTIDLDKPRAGFEFMSYREVAQAHFDKWGVIDTDPFAYLAELQRREFCRRWHEDNGR